MILRITSIYKLMKQRKNLFIEISTEVDSISVYVRVKMLTTTNGQDFKLLNGIIPLMEMT